MKGQRKMSDYDSLKYVFDAAFKQASEGKGKERHACDEPFEQQQIVEIGERLQDNPAAGPLFQAVKKIYESGRLDAPAAIAELMGAMVYTAAAVIMRQKKADYDVRVGPAEPGKAQFVDSNWRPMKWRRE
jgi:hypothetical protein